MEKAYMVRNDGKFFPVVQHYYGNPEEVTETLYAGEWLYDHTDNENVKKQIIKLIALYANIELQSFDDPVGDLIKEIERVPYVYLSTKFVKQHAKEIDEAFNSLTDFDLSNYESINSSVCDNLNQLFMRARFGGLYNTKAGSREMVFRISSSGFNWYDIIWNFVYSHEKSIDTVTIVRDEESTGVGDFYKTRRGEPYDRMPVDQFIMEKGNPIIESHCPVMKALQSGRALVDLFNLPMNSARVVFRYRAIVERENRKLSFGYDLMENSR